MSHKRRPSLLGALLWIGLGTLFLLQNFGAGIDFWSLAGRYWPVLLILLGLGKVIDYFLKKDAVSISIGEIFGILFLLFAGSALTRISNSHIAQIVREMPIQIGNLSVRPGQWLGESHAFTEEERAVIEHPLPILIENSYGSIVVTPGGEREVRVRLKKVVYANETRAKNIASEISLEARTERIGGLPAVIKAEAEPGKASDPESFVVRTNRDALSSKDYIFNTDLEVTVPPNSQLQVRNAFGDVRITGISGKIDITATHRALEVRDCTGNFTVSARFADSRLINLVGNVKLTSRSRGRVYIENVKGDLEATSEYSPLEVINVDGKVQLSNTEGSIRIEKVTKPVVIDSRGTQVQVKDLQNNLKLTASHKNVEIEDVSSDLNIESRYAVLTLKRIKGNIDIRSNSDQISANDIRGGFKLKGSGTGVRIRGIAGPLEIQTSLRDVVVDDFSDSCSVTSEHAEISVSPRILGKGEVNLRNQNGDVDIFLPEKASFIIDATARNGKIESDYEGLGLGQDREIQTLKSKVKNGGPKILLETSYGTIRIRPMQSHGEERPDSDDNSNESSSARLLDYMRIQALASRAPKGL